MSNPSASRLTALKVLLRVEKSGAYSNIYLDNVLKTSGLGGADRALVTELIYGTLRRQNTLDYYLNSFAKNPMSAQNPPIRIILRMSAYQLLYLDRIPAYSVCDEAVCLAKKFSGQRKSGFVNAVLRELVRKKDTVRLPEDDEVRHMALVHSHPEWLVRRWIGFLGREATERLCAANNEIPPLFLRANTVQNSRDELLLRLNERGIAAEPTRLAEEGIMIERQGGIRELPEFQQGLCYVQDEGAMIVGRALDPKPGQLVYDLCSAPGGKTTHLAELMGDRGTVVAFDESEKRLGLVEEACERLGLKSITTRAGDVRKLDVENLPKADRILVDAPCLGTGVLRRKPDGRWRKSPESLKELPKLQKQILRIGLSLVKPGGLLLYSTCSVEPEENEAVVAAMLAENANIKRGHLAARVPKALRKRASRGELRLYPHLDGTDGFYMCLLEVQGSNM